MENILNELITEIMSLGEDAKKALPKGMPTGLFAGSFGNYYHDKEHTQYAGKVKNNQWIPAAQEKEPSVDTPTTAEPTQAQPTADTPTASKYETEEGSWLASQVFGDVFSKGSATITRGKASINVRQVLDPSTGKGIDTSTDNGRKLALEVIDTQLRKLDKPIKDACTRLSLRGTDAQKQRIKKFLGNVGELYTLREMLSAGTEAYLLPDSYPKNDLVILTQDKKRGLNITEISVKSSTGEKVGALGSNARVPLHAAVEDKSITIDGAEYSAQDAIDASMFVYSQLLRFATEGNIVGEKREIVIKPNQMGKFDKETAKQAVEAGVEGKKGAQDLLLKARKITSEDLESFKNSSLMRGKNITPEHKQLIDYYISQLSEAVSAKRDFRLSNTKDIFTNQIANILEQTGSSLSFESDLVSVKFSDTQGFEGIKITPSEVMRQRASDLYGDISSMSILEQMKKLGNWSLRTRGLNTHNTKTREPMGGYAGAIINFAPPTDILQDNDRLTPQQYITFIQQQSTPTSKIG